jgi:hypothetical protein
MGNRIRRTAVATVAAAAACAAVLVGTSGPASAATVPNNYQCSIFTGLCVQINGRHVNGVPNACTWVVNFYAVGSPTSICNTWY